MEAEKLHEKAIEKKLKTFNNSQDSVNAVSQWIMVHRAQHRKIVDVWLKVMRKSETKHKLTLFYLCNDVVQRAKREKALYYLSCYKDILREAVYIVSEHETIKPKILRILNIWQERKIYDSKFVSELKKIMENESGGSDRNSSANATPNTPASYKPPIASTTATAPAAAPAAATAAAPAAAEKKVEKQERQEEEKKVEESKPMIKDTLKDMSEKEREEFSSRIVAEFKTTKFIDSITMLRRLEGEIDLKRKQLTTLRIDATSLEAVKQLKDRSHGKEFCKQFEDSCMKIEDYVNTLEREIIQRKAVLAMCENSEIFYDEQFKEAKIVANAYKNFGARVNNMKKKVDDRKKSIPATPSPVPSPSADAPSPGNTPPLQDMDDNEQIDMELDEEQDTSKHNDSSTNVTGRIAYTAMVKSIDHPISSITNISMGQQGTERHTKLKLGPHMDSLASKGSKASAPVQAPQPVPAPVQNVYNPKPLEKPKIDQFTAGGNVLESRIASMLPNLALGTSTLGSKFKPIPPAVSSAPQPVLSYTAPQPTKSAMEDNSDERAATPVMDEQEDDETPKEATPPRAETPERPKPATTSANVTLKTNPIDFLSQLLTKTTKSSSSSNFLHSLSLLTNTVKSQYQHKQQQSEASSVSDQAKSMMDSSFTTAPLSDNTSPVSVAPSPVEAPLTSTWSGWQINAAHPPLPPQPSPDQPPPPLPNVPLGALPAYRPQMPPQPTSPLGTPYQAPPSSGYQPHGTDGFNPVTTPGTYTAPGSQPYQVASSQPTGSDFIDPSLPPPPPTTQFQPAVPQQFPASPEPVPPRPTMQNLGPRSGFPPLGETKGYNPTTAFQQLLFSYGGARNPPPPQQGQNQGYTQSTRPWDQPPPGPPPEPSPPTQNQYQPAKPYGQWEQAEPQPPAEQAPPPSDSYDPWSPIVQKSEPQPSPMDPSQVSNAGPLRQFPAPSPYGTWASIESQQDSNDQPPQGASANTEKAYTPWDQPDKYPDQWEQPDMELESPPPEPERDPDQPHPAPAPAKGILRNRSSLREVQLVDDTMNTAATDEFTPESGGRLPIGMPSGERIPVGILKKPSYSPAIKKPPTDIITADQPTDVQSEFIAKLKRKTGGGNLVVPPVMSQDHNTGLRNNFSHGRDHSNLTTVQLRENKVEYKPPNPNIHSVILEEVEESEEYDPETTFDHNGENFGRNEEEQESSYQGGGDADFGENEQSGGFQEFAKEPVASFEGGGHFDHQEQLSGGQFESQAQIGEPISTIGVVGDRESRSSNDMDMDLESLEENQPPEQFDNQMTEVEGHEPLAASEIEGHMPHEGPQGDHWEFDKRREHNWQDRHPRQENWRPKFPPQERFQRPPRPRFDNFRPREPFSPYHRPFHDRFRGPRPRNFNPMPGPPPFYRY